MQPRLALFPRTTSILPAATGSRLSIAGCDLVELARQHGTPLYLYDQATMDAAVADYRQALAGYPGPSDITYAGKAFLNLAVARWAAGHGLWIDCTGQGEIAIAVAAGVPREQILVHGVNKTAADLASAVRQAGVIVVDNGVELARLIDLGKKAEPALSETTSFPRLWLRLRPGLAVQTHAYTQTGQADSKFGLSAAELRQAAELCQTKSLPLSGLHFHLGSHFQDLAPLAQAIDLALDLAAALELPAGWTLCPGGGLGVPYHEEDLPGLAISEYVLFIVERVIAGCRQHGLSLPRLQLEPGRSLVARAGVALYTVGSVKQTATRRWLLLDGGLADNPRPALYRARYSALPVREPERPTADEAWLAGPFCESGDVLIEALPFPDVEAGEVIAVPVSGAYQLSMSSNYNGARRPAVLWLADGQARLVQERERVADLWRRDAASTDLRFIKYQALGNDYLVLPDAPDLTAGQVQRICQRHSGIGADGILLPLESPAGSQFALRIFNPDGSEAEISGNGLRIFARYLWDEGLAGEGPFTIWSGGRLVTAQVHDEGRLVSVEMGRASFPNWQAQGETLDLAGQPLRFFALDLGNPHAVILRDEVSVEEARLGPLVEVHPRFPRRSNVQFLQVLDRRNLRIEIWERGAGYTLSSGSSSCAAAAVAQRLGLCDGDVTVHMPGGQLEVSISPLYDMSLRGPVEKVCWGMVAPELPVTL